MFPASDNKKLSIVAGYRLASTLANFVSIN